MEDPIAESLNREEPQVAEPVAKNSYGLTVEMQTLLLQQRFGDVLGLVARANVHPKARNVIAQLATQFGNCEISGNFRNVTDFVVDALIRGEAQPTLTEPAPTSPTLTEPAPEREGQVLQDGTTRASEIADKNAPRPMKPRPTSSGAGVVKQHKKPISRI